MSALTELARKASRGDRALRLLERARLWTDWAEDFHAHDMEPGALDNLQAFNDELAAFFHEQSTEPTGEVPR